MATPDVRLVKLVRAPVVDREEIARFLDGLSGSDRVQAVRGLGGAAVQRRLYDAVALAQPVTIDEIVPPDAPALEQVIYHGKNSLPAFTHFEKRFCRPSSTGLPRLWGYNHTSVARFVGPGYFTCHTVDDGLVAIDYRALPPEHPHAWPAIRPNSQGLSWFVYRDMVDYLRRVSKHVLIGAAHRHGTPLGNYFVLCREV